MIGVTLTRFLAGISGGIAGAFGGVLSKPSHMVEVAPWRDPTWRSVLSNVLREPPKDTQLWAQWFYEQRVKAIDLLPEPQRPLARTQLKRERLANQMEDEEWGRWYRYYHFRLVSPERDFLSHVQHGLYFNLQAAAVYVLVAAWFVPALRVWWCMLPAFVWLLMFLVEWWVEVQNAANLWSTLDRQITYLSELSRTSPASQPGGKP